MQTTIIFTSSLQSCICVEQNPLLLETIQNPMKPIYNSVNMSSMHLYITVNAPLSYVLRTSSLKTWPCHCQGHVLEIVCTSHPTKQTHCTGHKALLRNGSPFSIPVLYVHCSLCSRSCLTCLNCSAMY